MALDERESYTGLLHHVELYASDFARSVDFWEWFLHELGYSTHQEWENGKSWKQGPTYIVVVQADGQYRSIPYDRQQPGLNHLAFHARSQYHVDEMTAELRDRRVTVLYEDKHPYAGGEDHYAVYFEDPEGIKIELVAPNV